MSLVGTVKVLKELASPPWHRWFGGVAGLAGPTSCNRCLYSRCSRLLQWSKPGNKRQRGAAQGLRCGSQLREEAAAFYEGWGERWPLANPGRRLAGHLLLEHSSARGVGDGLEFSPRHLALRGPCLPAVFQSVPDALAGPGWPMPSPDGRGLGRPWTRLVLAKAGVHRSGLSPRAPGCPSARGPWVHWIVRSSAPDPLPARRAVQLPEPGSQADTGR